MGRRKTVIIFCYFLWIPNLYSQPAFIFDIPAVNGILIQKSFSPDPPEITQTDILHYFVQLEILDLPSQIDAEVKITFKSNIQNLTSCILHLHGLNISNISSRQGLHNFQRQQDLLTIQLNQPLVKDDTLSLNVAYNGGPGDDQSGGYFSSSEFIFTVGEGLNSDPPSMTRYWMPCKDVPWDKATLKINITVQDYLYAASNGKLEKITSDVNSGKKTYYYSMAQPVATYLIAFAISTYQPFSNYYISDSNDSIEFIFYVPENLRSAAEIDFSNLPKMMKVFIDRFGPYPFDRYGTAVAPMGGASAMEHQSMTTYSTYLITGNNRYDPIVAHELAHQWWGDWVTLSDWGEIWLNEGFASYSEVIYLETVWTQKQIENYLLNNAVSYFDEVARRGYFSLADPDYYWGATVYKKGALVLHMLRNQVGDENFWHILKQYGSRYAYGNATISGFIDVVNEISGDNLDWFFDQWIYSAGYPELNLEWRAEKKSGKMFEVDVVITQTQEIDQIFKLSLEVSIVTLSDTINKQIEIISQTSSAKIIIPEAPITIIADPHHKLLLKTKYFSGVYPKHAELRQNYPNPFVKNIYFDRTTIEFVILKDRSPVEIKIYNSLGQEVRLLTSEVYPIGKHKLHWDGKDQSGNLLANGIYIYVLKTTDEIRKKRMVFLKQN